MPGSPAGVPSRLDPNVYPPRPSDIIDLYSCILTVCAIVAVLNYHRIKFPLPVSLSLAGLIVSIILVVVDAGLTGNPVRAFTEKFINMSDFDEVRVHMGGYMGSLCVVLCVGASCEESVIHPNTLRDGFPRTVLTSRHPVTFC